MMSLPFNEWLGTSHFSSSFFFTHNYPHDQAVKHMLIVVMFIKKKKRQFIVWIRAYSERCILTAVHQKLPSLWFSYFNRGSTLCGCLSSRHLDHISFNVQKHHPDTFLKEKLVSWQHLDYSINLRFAIVTHNNIIITWWDGMKTVWLNIFYTKSHLFTKGKYG